MGIIPNTEGLKALVHYEDRHYYAEGGWLDVMEGRSQYLMEVNLYPDTSHFMLIFKCFDY